MIGYYAHDQGSGHLTRMQTIAAALDEPVWALSSADRPIRWRGGWTSLARDDTPTAGDLADRDPTAHGVLHWAPRHHSGLARRSAQVTAWAAEHAPRALVVDVSVEIALLARLCGVPTVVVAMPGHRQDPAHRLAYDSAEALLAPWPRGAHDRDWPRHWTEKAWFVGAISRFDHRTPPVARAASERRRVLVMWGFGGRATTAAQVQAAAAATPEWTWVERSPLTSRAEDAVVDLWSDLVAADVVVTHAGQNAVAEVAAARRPAVVVAQPRPHDEQVATARRIDECDIAVGCETWPDASAWPKLLARASSHTGQEWDRWSTGSGAAQAARHLRDLASGSPIPRQAARG